MYKISINRYIFLLILIFVIFYYTPSDGMVKYSFRLRGLGTNLVGFVDDLYSDLYFNPAYISRYKERYVYTNLSNLQGKGEATVFEQDDSEINKNGDFPSNLIGIVGGFKRYSIGGFWESSGHSFQITDESEYEDFQPNPALRTRSSNIFKGDFTGQSFTMLGIFRNIGYIISFDKLGMDINWSAKNDTTLLDNPTAIRTYTDEEKGEVKFPNNLLSFAVGKIYKNDKREVSISGGMMPQRLGINLNRIFPVLKKPFIDGGDENLTKFDEKDLGYMELGIKSYFLNLRYKKIYTELDRFHQNNWIFNFAHYRLPLNIKATGEFIADTTITSSEGSILSYRKNIIEDEVTGEGTASINSLTFGFGTERHFDGLKSMSVIGLKFQYIWGDFELDNGPGRRTEEFHKFFGERDSTLYENVFNDNKITATRGKANTLMISIPVGLEMKLTNNFTFRLGANASIPISFDGNWKRTITDSTNTLISSSGVGQSYNPDNKPMFTEEKVSKLKGKLINLTSYHFGASYKVSDSIKVDFLNFAEITNLKKWWISVVFKY